MSTSKRTFELRRFNVSWKKEHIFNLMSQKRRDGATTGNWTWTKKEQIKLTGNMSHDRVQKEHLWESDCASTSCGRLSVLKNQSHFWTTKVNFYVKMSLFSVKQTFVMKVCVWLAVHCISIHPEYVSSAFLYLHLACFIFGLHGTGSTLRSLTCCLVNSCFT